MLRNAFDIPTDAELPNLLAGFSEPIWNDLAALDELATHAAEVRRAVMDHRRVTAIVQHNRQFVRIRQKETEEALADLQHARHRIQINLIGLDRCQGITVPAIRAEFGR